jgi:dTDP-4-amino-4,6-dideoxygalactose transaminase
MTIDPDALDALVTPRTKAIVAVDYAGQPADLDEIARCADRHGLTVIEDACHAPGATYRARRVGAIAHYTVFSFHPVKHITTGEGGLVTTVDPKAAQRLREFRNHGITSSVQDREHAGTWVYEMQTLGYNYRLTDLQCALGLSQLERLPQFLVRRQAIANRYDRAFAGLDVIECPVVRPDRISAWHLYVIRLHLDRLRAGRREIFEALRAENIGVNVHYIPVPWHPYYQALGFRKGGWPEAEASYERMLSLPIFPGMSDDDAGDVERAVVKVLRRFAR